jgi:glutathione S-transferase
MEKGFCGDLELVACNPHERGPELLAHNPMSRVPTLVLDDGTALYDSPVICEWLDASGEGPILIPPDGLARWRVLRIQALADGMMDDAYDNVMETRRPESRQSPDDIEARRAALLRGAAAMTADLASVVEPVSLAQIASACALAYLDFRLPSLHWRSGNDDLASWFRDFSERSSMAATRPDA